MLTSPRGPQSHVFRHSAFPNPVLATTESTGAHLCEPGAESLDQQALFLDTSAASGPQNHVSNHRACIRKYNFHLLLTTLETVN